MTTLITSERAKEYAEVLHGLLSRREVEDLLDAMTSACFLRSGQVTGGPQSRPRHIASIKQRAARLIAGAAQ